MIDNFQLIKTLLDFSDPLTFYFVQILKRRKENPDMATGVSVVNNYYIYSDADLEKLRPKIITDCTLHNARAYINVNRLDLERIAVHTLNAIGQMLLTKDYRNVKNAYAAACGAHHAEKPKRWVIDLDDNIDHPTHGVEKMKEFINAIYVTMNNDSKILAQVPTKNGLHLICNPFDVREFVKIWPKVDIQKNAPTLLYI